MTAITFQTSNGNHTIDVPDGTSLMKAAVEEGLPGIVGECGGNAMCGTCHVYTDLADAERLPALTDTEDEMLDGTASERLEGSRLSCQLLATPDMAGLVVKTPPRQL